MIKIDQQDAALIEVTFGGEITHEDYQAVIPKFDEAIAEHGQLRLLCKIETIDGVSPRAIVDDLKWDWKHRNDIEKCAVVAEGSVLEASTKAVGLLYSGEFKHFEPDQIEEARQWLRQ